MSQRNMLKNVYMYTLKNCSFLKTENNSSWVNIAHFWDKTHIIALELIKNTSNDISHFSISVTELEFQSIGCLASHFLITFIRKLTQMPILTLFSRILDGLTEKKLTLLDFPLKNKTSTNFISLQSKFISKKCQKVRSLDEKAKQIVLRH